MIGVKIINGCYWRMMIIAECIEEKTLELFCYDYSEVITEHRTTMLIFFPMEMQK